MKREKSWLDHPMELQRCSASAGEGNWRYCPEHREVVDTFFVLPLPILQ